MKLKFHSENCSRRYNIPWGSFFEYRNWTSWFERNLDQLNGQSVLKLIRGPFHSLKRRRWLEQLMVLNAEDRACYLSQLLLSWLRGSEKWALCQSQPSLPFVLLNTRLARGHWTYSKAIYQSASVSMTEARILVSLA